MSLIFFNPYAFFITAVSQSNLVSAVGATVTTATISGSNYTIYTFSTVGSSSLTIASTISADIVVIAGGGGGGSDRGGGGGAGGYQYLSNQSLTAGTYTITVGAGGTGTTATGVSGGGTRGNNGSNSQFGALTASVGGGGGGGCSGGTNIKIGLSGGSGGGGSQFNGAGAGGSNTTGQGNIGGTGYEAGAAGGGGGQASAGGNAAAGGVGGVGGAGIVDPISNTSTTWCSGGGGGTAGTGAVGGTGAGTGGNNNGNGTSATTYGSGGGGGGQAASAQTTGGNGYQGVVVVRFLTSSITTGSSNNSNNNSSMTTFLFTNLGATGNTGPTSLSNYGSNYPGYGTASPLTISNSIQYWTVPQTGTYQLIAAGAGYTQSGNGVVVSSTVNLTASSTIAILVGQSSGSISNGNGATYICSFANGVYTPLLIAGGGGCVYTSNVNTSNANAVVTTTGANGSNSTGGSNGNGGGAVYNGGGGGGGFTSNGNSPGGNDGYGYGISFSNYAASNLTGLSRTGAFGGGASVASGYGGFGGGGGYSGGGGGAQTANSWGGGGGSYDVNGTSNNATLYTGTLPASVSNQVTNGYNSGNGFAIWSINISANSNVNNVNQTDLLSLGSTSLVASNSNTIVVGTKLLISTYSGPLIQLQRVSDSATADFYPYYNNELFTGPNGTGSNVVTWLNAGGSNLGYIRILYNQTGSGYNFTTGANANCTLLGYTKMKNAYPISFFNSANNLIYNSSGTNASVAYSNATFALNFQVTSIQSTTSVTGSNAAGAWSNSDAILFGDRSGVTNDFGIVLVNQSTPSIALGSGISGTDTFYGITALSGSNTPNGVVMTMTIANSTIGISNYVNGTSLTQSSTASVAQTQLLSSSPLYLGYNNTRGIMNSLSIIPSTISSASDISILSTIVNSNLNTYVYEYPPAALTAGTQTAGSGTTGQQAFNCVLSNSLYGNGTYYTSSSSIDGVGVDLPWCAFNKTTGTANGTSIWISAGPLYSTSSPFGYTGSTTTTISGTAIGGEWLQIQLPYPIVLTSYSIQARSDTYATSQSPSAWYLAGSMDGTTWTLLDSRTGQTSWTQSAVFGYAISSANAASYSYYRIVVTNVTSNSPSSGGYSAIGELRLYALPSTTYPLDNLSASARSYLRGAWSLRALFKESASFPVIQLQNSAGSVIQNFYGDSTGTSLTTGQTGTGTTVASWMTTNSISTAYVKTWYDQSQYVNGGTAFNATGVSGTTLPYLNTSTTPYTVDNSTGNGYFTMPLGTVVGNGTYSFITRTNIGNIYGGIIGGGTAANSLANNLRWGSASSAYNYWYNNDFNPQLAATIPVPCVFSMVNYVNGTAPTASNGVYSTGGTTSTQYLTAGYINGGIAVINPMVARNNWVYTPSNNNDRLMTTIVNELLQSQMFYCINMSQGVSGNDRVILETIDLPSPIVYLPLTSNISNIGSGAQIATIGGTMPFATISGVPCITCTNASNAYVQIPYGINLPSQLTVSFWLYANDNNTYYTLFSISGSSRASSNAVLNVDLQNISANTLTYYSTAGTNWAYSINSGNNSIPINAWTHYAVTINQTNSTLTVYINGVQKGTSNVATPGAWGSNNRYMYIGRAGDDIRGFNGYINQFQMYNYILTPSQISYVYNSVTLNNEYPPVQSTSSFWNLTNPGTSTGSNTVTVSGAPYGNGTYITTQSSFNNIAQAAWSLFNKSLANDTLWFATSAYNGTYTVNTVSTQVSGATVYGEWVQIKLPNAIILTSFSFWHTQGNGDAPVSWVMAGSTDGSTWTTVQQQTTSLSFTNSCQIVTTGFSGGLYNYYRFIITANKGNLYTSLLELKLFGY